ncbi:MAG: virulence RhuM family protein [Bacteroidales bacterium]|nr:virulence RhuM family protein [Bacteroidales bacterium]
MQNFTPTSKGEIAIYQPDNSIHLEVLTDQETVWLTQAQMVLLFDRDKSVISRHIRNIFDEEELLKNSVVANFATTASDGKTYAVEYYSLDVIISVGYRVKSKQGTYFRQWANKILKDYILKGYAINQRFERIEERVSNTEHKIDFFVKTALPPIEGVFFDGQIFDAYVFVSDLIKSAKKSITLIDNYVDESVLLLLSKRKKNVSAKILTANFEQMLKQDLSKHNAQYPPIKIEKFTKSHDRFLIIDDTQVYHIGASLKDLGKKWFGFSKIENDWILTHLP